VRFITEEELRNLYKKSPFTTFESEADTRLTPGARQFLGDRRIQVCSAESRLKVKKQAGNKQEKTTYGKEDIQEELLELQLAEAVFLKSGLELLEEDVLAAQEIFSLEEYLMFLRLNNGASQPDYIPCTRINQENFHTWMEDCFEVTGFHAQSQKGKTIVTFHYLRCVLRILETKLTDSRRTGIHCVINKLSQMICTAFGGKVCQKKI
jgi:hypothetical protein